MGVEHAGEQSRSESVYMNINKVTEKLIRRVPMLGLSRI